VCKLHWHVVHYTRGHSCLAKENLVSTLICNAIERFLFMSTVMESIDCRVQLLMDGSTEGALEYGTILLCC
jgi:hypothetical protein